MQLTHIHQTENAKPAKSKPQNEGEKLVVRRLPPAMTEAEFLSILGEEWEVGQGRVDWFSYSEGKVSKEYVVLPKYDVYKTDLNL